MKNLTKVAILPAIAASAALPAVAHAAGTGTVADLGAAADFSDVKGVMITVALAIIGVLVLWFGIRKVKGSIR